MNKSAAASSNALRLNVIVASTRPGRVGPAVASWVVCEARDFKRFDVRCVDLAEFQLPLYNEHEHPRSQRYAHEHTRRWAESVADADAFVIVAPEYNHSPTPALLNALIYLYNEWNYKPAALVSYGGVSGGLRAAQALKVALTALKVVPIVEGIVVPLVASHVRDGVFTATEMQKEAARTLLVELHRWAEALKPLRNAAPE